MGRGISTNRAGRQIESIGTEITGKNENAEATGLGRLLNGDDPLGREK
jgi:hypothetical protein